EPPRMCQCRWKTVWPAPGPQKIISRYSSSPACLAVSATKSSIRFASGSDSRPMSRNVSMCSSGITSRWTSAFGFASSIARSPSPRLTTVAGSSPAWILQKTQSGSRGTDALLRHRRAADADELADGAVDEPRRVVVAVAATGPIDEDEVVGADLLPPAAQARLVRARAQPGAALPLHLPRHRVGRSGGGARARRVREDVHAGHPRPVDHPQRILERALVLRRKADDHVRRQVEAL